MDEKIIHKKKKKERSNKKALFIQRFGAYLIDIFIVTMLASLISTPFINTKNNEKLQDEAIQIVEKMQNGEVSVQEYFAEYSSIFYKLARNSGGVTIISLLLSTLFFVVYQFYQGGQTIGKKLVKIKVVSDDGELTMDQMVIRSLLANSILVDLLTFTLMLFVGKNSYFYCVGLIESIQFILVVISVIMIIKRKDGCSIHDKIAHTRVVRL